MIIVSAIIPPKTALDGQYCRLEPLDAALHGDDLFAEIVGQESERLHRYLFEAPPTRPVFDAWLLASVQSADPLFFAVINKSTGRAAGRQAFMRITPEHGTIEIGNILWGPSIAGTRIATEALYLHAKHAFELGYRRFEWKCNNANEPSKRAAIRFGFQFEGVFRQHMVAKGLNRDTAWYSMLDSEWPVLKAAYDAWLDPANFNDAGQQKAALATPRC